MMTRVFPAVAGVSQVTVFAADAVFTAADLIWTIEAVPGLAAGG